MRHSLIHARDETLSCPITHPDYYFDDGTLVILVEGTLYRIFRSTLTRHSAVFRDMFSLPGPVGGPPEGLDDDNPIRFSGISSMEFERLLWILYPAKLGVWKACTQEEWISVLSLATRWEFNDVRSLAIQQLKALDMNPVDRITLAQEFDIPGRWALSAYTALCERPEPLSLQEASRLGLETAMRIAQLREQLRAGGRKSSRMGGYHTLTRNAAIRHDTSGVAAVTTRNARPPRAERSQWGIGKTFLDHGDIAPPMRIALQRTATKRGAAAIPGTTRLVAQAFGIDLSS